MLETEHVQPTAEVVSFVLLILL